MNTKEIREKNHCNTCERRGGHITGCQAFKEEPVNCWAWTDDKDWLAKVEKAVKDYTKNRSVE